jgi:hypothetical protein
MTESLSSQIAYHARCFFFGGNWTDVNLKKVVSDVDWKMATAKVRSFNTIAQLVYHIHYFVAVVNKVLEGGPLVGNDKVSFNHPPISSQKDWEQLLQKTWEDAALFSDLIEKLPENTLWKYIGDEKYGSYYRNLHGIIEHSHYHLGQIVIIKKMLLDQDN